MSQHNDQIQDISPEQTMGALGFQRTIQGLLSAFHTVNIVQVVGVKNINILGEIGTCEIRPLTMLVDGANNTYERGVISEVPYFRFQGGKNAVICDPSIGDIGLALFCERDITMVKSTKKASKPNTKRQNDLNDAVYLGGFLNGAPEQYIHFVENGINIKSKGDININGLKISANGKIKLTNGTIVDDHVHSQAPDSNGDTQQDTGKGHN